MEQDQQSDFVKESFEERITKLEERITAIEARSPKLPGLPKWSRFLRIASVPVGAAVLILLMAASRFSATHTSGRIAAAHSDLETLSDAIQNFRFDTGRFPRNAEGFEALWEPPRGLEKKWKGPYLTEPLVNDPWGHPYIYQFDPDGSFLVESRGPTGKPGGRGKDAPIVQVG